MSPSFALIFVVSLGLTLNNIEADRAVFPNASLCHQHRYSSVTLFESTDGGASFHLALPPPHHLVATSPYDNRNGDLGRGPGFGMPSSILRDPHSSWHYVMLLTNWGRDVGAQAGGLCLLRSNNIADPASWLAWGGDERGFSVNVRATPLLEPVSNPEVHTCEVLKDTSGSVLTLRHVSLLWSTYVILRVH